MLSIFASRSKSRINLHQRASSIIPRSGWAQKFPTDWTQLYVRFSLLHQPSHSLQLGLFLGIIHRIQLFKALGQIIKNMVEGHLLFIHAAPLPLCSTSYRRHNDYLYVYVLLRGLIEAPKGRNEDRVATNQRRCSCPPSSCTECRQDWVFLIINTRKVYNLLAAIVFSQEHNAQVSSPGNVSHTAGYFLIQYASIRRADDEIEQNLLSMLLCGGDRGRWVWTVVTVEIIC